MLEKKYIKIFLYLIPFFISACANTDALKNSSEFSPVLPMETENSQLATGSIFDSTKSDTMFGRKRDFKVGDVILVTLSESTQSSRTQGITTSRVSSNDMISTGMADALRPKIGGTLFDDVKLTGNTISNTGSGNSSQQATLAGTIAATVVDVLSNGNLVIRGEKKLSLTEGSEMIRVSGIIRSEDIAPNNSVSSSRIAHAKISYRADGDLASASRAGWGTRALQKFWPF